MANARQLDKKKWILQSYKNGIRKTFRGSSRGEVEKAERDWLKDLETYGKELKRDKAQLSSLMYEQLFVNVKPNVSSGTFEKYMSTYNTHLKDCELGKKDIKNISQVELQKFLNSKADLSHSSLKSMYIILRGTYKHAVVNDLLRINIMNDVIIPKSKYEGSGAIETFDLNEQRLYLSVVNETQYKEIITTALCTGMRQGELIALKWKNVDLDNEIIKVRETARIVRTYDNEGFAKDEYLISDPKTKKSNRSIPISKNVANMLKKLKLKNGGLEDDYVFVTKKNEHFKNDTLTKMHKVFCKRAGIKVISFHSLRHTFATQSIKVGVNVKTLSEILGHADVSITLNRYVHSDEHDMRAAIEKIDKLIINL